MNSRSSNVAAPIEDPTLPASKTWRAGTLTYTSTGLVVLFCWLLFGDFAWSMRERSVGPMAQWYLASLKVPNFVFGLLLSSFPALIGLILGPIISVKSDRHRGARGRRIPFLLVTTPIAAFGMIGLGFTPFLAKSLHRLVPSQNEVVVAVVCFGVFWACFEIATIVAQAVFGGLINDVVPKPLLGRFFGLFRAVSLIDGMIFNYWIMGHVPSYFTSILVGLGVFYGSAFLWVCFKVREGAYPLPPPRELTNDKRPLKRVCTEVGGYFKESFASPYYVFVFVMFATGGLVFLPVNTFAIPYAQSLGVDMQVYGKFLALTFLISFSLAFFLGWLADVFHPLRMAMATLTCYGVVAAWGAVFATTASSFLIAWVLHGVLSGCYMTSAASLGQRLFPHSQYAQFASAAGITGSLAHVVLGPTMGGIIDRSGNVYRYTFAAGAGLAVIALIAAWLVYVRFTKLGGPADYVAPGNNA